MSLETLTTHYQPKQLHTDEWAIKSWPGRRSNESVNPVEAEIAEFKGIFEAFFKEDDRTIDEILAPYPEHFRNYLVNANCIISDIDHTQIGGPPPLETFKVPKQQIIEMFPDILEVLELKELPDTPKDTEKSIKSVELPMKGYNIDASILGETDLSNLDSVIADVLMGSKDALNTGKDVMAYPIMFYVHDRLMRFVDLANRLCDMGHPLGIRFDYVHEEETQTPGVDLRPLTIDGKSPAYLALGTGNGAQVRDVFRGFELITDTDRLIPDDFWIKIASDREDNDLLRVSSSDYRRYQLYVAFEEYRLTPQQRDQVQQQFEQAVTDEERASLAKKLFGGHINISYSGGKANIVLDTKKIIGNRDIHERWLQRTGTDFTEENIHDPRILLQTVQKLFSDQFGPDVSKWPVELAIAKANGFIYIDINPKNVNKGTTVPIIEAHAARIHEEHTGEKIEIVSIKKGDMHHGNDESMLRGKDGSVTVSHDVRVPRIDADGPLVFMREQFPEIEPKDILYTAQFWKDRLAIKRIQLREQLAT